MIKTVPLTCGALSTFNFFFLAKNSADYITLRNMSNSNVRSLSQLLPCSTPYLAFQMSGCRSISSWLPSGDWMRLRRSHLQTVSRLRMNGDRGRVSGTEVKIHLRDDSHSPPRRGVHVLIPCWKRSFHVCSLGVKPRMTSFPNRA